MRYFFLESIVSCVEICPRRIKIRDKLSASTFIVIPHTKRVNVGCIMHFVLTEGFGLLLYEYFCEIAALCFEMLSIL